jgi:hypothetical protein
MHRSGGDLASFLQKLSEDTELQHEYSNDPRGTMQKVGLSDDVIDATMSRNLGRIKSVLSGELGAEPQVVMVPTDPNV